MNAATILLSGLIGLGVFAGGRVDLAGFEELSATESSAVHGGKCYVLNPIAACKQGGATSPCFQKDAQVYLVQLRKVVDEKRTPCVLGEATEEDKKACAHYHKPCARDAGGIGGV